MNRIATILLLLLFFHPSVAQQSSSSREQLSQYVADLQKNPSDDALREKTIKLASQLTPPPAIPEDANRHFVKGGVFQKEAKEKADYQLAVEEYRKALLVAPWWGEAYYNLGIALESAQDFDGAAVQYKLYLLTNPAEKDANETRNRMYALEAKKELAAKHVADESARAQEAARARDQAFVGTWYLGAKPFIEISGTSPPAAYLLRKTWAQSGGGITVEENGSSLTGFQVQGRDVKFTVTFQEFWRVGKEKLGENRHYDHNCDLTMSDDGKKLTGKCLERDSAGSTNFQPAFRDVELVCHN